MRPLRKGILGVQLKAELPIRGDRISYSYETTSDLHSVVFASNCAHVTGSAGAIVNVLAPYRDYRWVNELVNWLCQ
jgi:hypothetical protein